VNQARDRESLLADVLAEESSAGFREALLTETLALVRRQRRARQALRATYAMALVVGLGALVWRILPPAPLAPLSPGRAYTVLTSRPLPPAALVSTQVLSASRIVASAASAAMIQTASRGDRVREIDDSELLALLGARPAVLVRLGPHRAELVFVNAEDEGELFRD
jgi:hypothetical protein